MKIIVTHTSPDWDAIGSVWLLKRYFQGWDDAHVEFVPAGQRYKDHEVVVMKHTDDPIEKIYEDEVIHVDTGMTPLDHHQTYDTTISAAGLTWEYIKQQIARGKGQLGEGEKAKDKTLAIDRIVKVIVDTDHFTEVFWPEAAADYHDFSVLGALDGLKLMKPDQDKYYLSWGMEILDSLVHYFENKVWAEKEIKKNGITFQTRWGAGIGFETINDDVLKLSQKMGYRIAVRKDPRKGYIRIKARPATTKSEAKSADTNIDLTLVYEKLRKIDPDATWFLHVSKKMLLNGTPKNPKMIPTKLSLQQIIDVIESI